MAAPLVALLFATCLCRVATAQTILSAPAAAPGPLTVFPSPLSAPAVTPPAAVLNGTGGALQLPGVQQLFPGVVTPVQSVGFDNLTFFYFVLPNATADISVKLIQLQGDADLYVVEPQNPAPFAKNGFDQNGWQSLTAVNESIFIPRSDAFYSTGTYAVGIQGYGKGTSDFQLLVQFTAQKRVLVPGHKAAIQSIFDTCCNATIGACDNWIGVGGLDDSGAIAVELCELQGWECSVDGQLETADFTRFGLTCPFPWATLGSLTSLETLTLTNNSLSGPVDWTLLATLPNLQTLMLNKNAFTGSVPCTLATPGLPLLVLHLADNKFNGTLPACYVQKPELRVLFLNNNGFNGPLPLTIPANSELRSIHIANAGASGTLTADYGLPLNLQTIEFSQNRITGTIPLGIAGSRLDTLLLNNNLLTGPIPTDLTTAPQLRTLVLSRNQLTGGIGDFANAQVLEQVILTSNNLTGAMPQTWNCPQLLSFGVSNNFLSGSIPISLITLPNFFAFAAANNLLTGPLPPLATSQTSAVRIFNVTSNRLTGPIPTTYSKLPVFDFRSAKLDPTTGQVLAQVFDASYNILNGTVPAFFQANNLPSWTFVDLAGNELTCSGSGTKVANVQCGVPAGISTGGTAGPYSVKGPVSGTAAPVSTPVPGAISIVDAPGPSDPAVSASAANFPGTSSSSSAPLSTESGGGGLSTGAIVGIVVGILAGVIVLAALSVLVYTRVIRQRRETVQAKSFKRFASMDAEPV